MGSRKIVVEFLGRDTSLGRTADGLGKKTGGLKLGLGKLAGAFAGLAVVSKATGFLKDANAEARESQKVNAITANAIRATGGAAKVTAKDVAGLAKSISNKTGVDDEAVQSGSNLLLTFKNIRNEAGKGNKVFDQATKAAVDLSAAGFGSIDNASKMLGKALNDPVKGITALGRAGVTFSDKQKKMIAGFVKQGDMLSAQKVILGEVKSQVGGAAEASATAGDKLRTTWNNFKEDVGTKLLPVLDRAAVFLANKVIPALSNMGPVLAKIGQFVRPVVDFFRKLAAGAQDGGGKFAQFRATVASVWENVKSIFTSAISIVTSLWKMFGGTITTFAIAAFKNLQQIIGGAFQVIAGIFKVVSALLRGDWKGVWDGIKMIVKGAWKVIKGVVNLGWNVIKAIFKAAGTVVKSIFGGIWNGVKSLAKKGIDTLVRAVKAVPGKIRAIGGAMKSAGKWILTKLFDGLKSAGGLAGGVAKAVWNAVKRLLNNLISGLNRRIPDRIGPFDLPNNPVPRLAKGGIVKARPGGTLAILGEGGRDEAVIPLGRNGGARGAVASGNGRPGSGGDTYVFNISGVIGDEAAVMKRIHQAFLKRKRETGMALGLS